MSCACYFPKLLGHRYIGYSWFGSVRVKKFNRTRSCDFWKIWPGPNRKPVQTELVQFGWVYIGFLFWKPEKQIAPIKLYQYKEKDNYVEGEDTNNKTKITNN
jgi:hypothetical protein